MVTELNVTVLRLNTGKKVREPASYLRGFFAKHYGDNPIFHHHLEEGLIYTYPKVQYKIIEGVPIVVGIGDGGITLLSICGEIDTLNLGGNVYKVNGLDVSRKSLKYGGIGNKIQYRFVTPWLGLNASNYRKFKENDDWGERKTLLNRILVGNLLSMSKGFDYVVEKRLEAHSHFDIDTVEYKGIPHIGFTGEFVVNFLIPDLMGLGMGVSQGFGTVIRA